MKVITKVVEVDKSTALMQEKINDELEIIYSLNNFNSVLSVQAIDVTGDFKVLITYVTVD